jgi:DNA gyrase subunit A
MATKKGVVKKTEIKAYEQIRKSGIISIKLSQGDSLRWAKQTKSDDFVLLISKKGMSIKFKESDVRSMARDTMGVRGIKIKEGDELIGMDVIGKEDIKADLLVITEKGIGKKTNIGAWPMQLRGGVGVKAASLAEKTGNIVNAQVLTKDDEGIILTSKKGQVMRTTLKSVPRLTRDTQGVILMRLSGEDRVSAATVIQKKKDEEEIEEEAGLKVEKPKNEKTKPRIKKK